MSVETLDDDLPLQRLLAALPAPLRRAFLWLQRRPPWLRLLLGVLLVIGGLFGFLPILGFWMAPLGIFLLAEDIPSLRRPTMRALGSMQDWWDRRHACDGKANGGGGMDMDVERAKEMAPEANTKTEADMRCEEPTNQQWTDHSIGGDGFER